MAITTALAFEARGQSSLQSGLDWNSDACKVKKLYLERRYKQCAALCDKIIQANKTIRPLHQTFLYFFKAICYESLGMVAHNFSNNKIPFFVLARDAFSSALDVLPQPFFSIENGRCSTPVSSGAEDFLSTYSPTESQVSTPVTDSPSPQLRHFTDDEESVSFMVQSFTEDSPSISLQSLGTATDMLFATTPKSKAKMELKSRLSQSLSQNHVFDDSLMPSPLSVQKKCAMVADNPRSLPPLPFNHQAIFQRRGSRHIQVPTLRKTAIHPLLSTEIPRFQLPPLAPIPFSPLTPRYAKIHAAFNPKTPTRYDLPLDQYLSSTTLARYSEYLSSFRSQLIAHIAAVSISIATAEQTQRQRTLERQNRMASYWLLAPTAVLGEDEEKGAKAKAEKKERMERLRRDGWVVRKEKVGWKGSAYYDELRRRAEEDLEALEKREIKAL